MNFIYVNRIFLYSNALRLIYKSANFNTSENVENDNITNIYPCENLYNLNNSGPGPTILYIGIDKSGYQVYIFLICPRKHGYSLIGPR